MAVAANWEASNATGINGNQADNSIPQAGAVYIFTRNGGTWRQQAYLKASNTGEAGEAGDGDQFGFSLALSDDGNTVAAGAIAEDSNATGINGNQADNSANSAGAVYVFARTGTTVVAAGVHQVLDAAGGGRERRPVWLLGRAECERKHAGDRCL